MSATKRHEILPTLPKPHAAALREQMQGWERWAAEAEQGGYIKAAELWLSEAAKLRAQLRPVPV